MKSPPNQFKRGQGHNATKSSRYVTGDGANQLMQYGEQNQGLQAGIMEAKLVQPDPLSPRTHGLFTSGGAVQDELGFERQRKYYRQGPSVFKTTKKCNQEEGDAIRPGMTLIKTLARSSCNGARKGKKQAKNRTKGRRPHEDNGEKGGKNDFNWEVKCLGGQNIWANLQQTGGRVGSDGAPKNNCRGRKVRKKVGGKVGN